MLLLQDLAASPSAPRTDKQERNIPRPWKYILNELERILSKSTGEEIDLTWFIGESGTSSKSAIL